MPDATWDEFQFHTPDAKAGVLYLRALPAEDLLTIARDENSAQHAAATVHIGEGTNPYWVTSTAAEEAYRRDLMDPEEMDRICDY